MSKRIFREYIGVKPSSANLHDFPSEIINTETLEFQYILGFASEAYDKSGKGTGIFKETWNAAFFGPEKVKTLKTKFPNVKVIISIGGRDVTPFDPAEENIWVTEAIESLKVIIQKYKNESGNIIDGIDINYEKIKSNDLFVNCIGQVITELKNDNDLNIQVVSIAPSEKNASSYLNLYTANRDAINWVNYQFSNQVKVVSTSDAFVDIYNGLVQDYNSDIVLPGFSTDPLDTSHAKITRDTFIAGCKKLIQTSSLPGAFIWNANDSAIPPPGQNKPYIVELTLQQLLAKE